MSFQPGPGHPCYSHGCDGCQICRAGGCCGSTPVQTPAVAPPPPSHADDYFETFMVQMGRTAGSFLFRSHRPTAGDALFDRLAAAIDVPSDVSTAPDREPKRAERPEEAPRALMPPSPDPNALDRLIEEISQNHKETL